MKRSSAMRCQAFLAMYIVNNFSLDSISFIGGYTGLGPKLVIFLPVLEQDLVDTLEDGCATQETCIFIYKNKVNHLATTTEKTQ